MHKGNPQVEEYLEAIYRLKEDGRAARTNELAASLGVSPASASEMIGRLRDRGLLTHERYGIARLTPRGERIGKRVTEKHRLIERFLSAIGMEGDLHGEACVLEHAVSDEVAAAMRKFVSKKKMHE